MRPLKAAAANCHSRWGGPVLNLSSLLHAPAPGFCLGTWPGTVTSVGCCSRPRAREPCCWRALTMAADRPWPAHPSQWLHAQAQAAGCGSAAYSMPRAVQQARGRPGATPARGHAPGASPRMAREQVELWATPPPQRCPHSGGPGIQSLPRTSNEPPAFSDGGFPSEFSPWTGLRCTARGSKLTSCVRVVLRPRHAVCATLAGLGPYLGWPRVSPSLVRVARR